ncbi:hypothetical protein [Spiroplasma endosymbiont of Panorpa germanica]|uniref:hypothetical protein n=1 Tax=Spiroplasma endosymbiont of Panorpa germanica TaxID=3066314 RepID=UPI0030D34B0C
MKKLLAILATTTFVISAPLSVIACGKKIIPEKDQFDYNRLINEYLAAVNSIFSSEIAAAFEGYQFVSDEDLPKSITFEQIQVNQDQFKEKSGPVYEEFLSWVKSVIPTDKINKAIIEDLNSDVNYNPILVDKGTSLKNGIQVNSINVIDKEFALTFDIEIIAGVTMKMENEETRVETISTNSIVNIFDEKALADKAKEAQTEYTDIINNKIANKIEFESDSGDLDKNQYEIDQSSKIMDFVKKSIKFSNTEIELIDTDMKLETVKNLYQHGGTAMSWNDSFSVKTNNLAYQTFIKALKGEEEATETLMKNIQGNDAEWRRTESFLFDELALAEEAIKNGEPAARALNHWGLKYNIRNNGILDRLIGTSKSSFEINLENDKKAIVVFPAEIKGLQFKFNEKHFDLPVQNLFVKQVITYEDTLSYYNDFIKSGFEFNKAFLSIGESEKGNDIFNLTAPTTWSSRDFVNKTFKWADFPFDELMFANEEANKWNSKFNAKAEFVYASSLFYFSSPKYIYVRDDGQIFTWVIGSDKKGLALNKVGLITSIFPNQTTSTKPNPWVFFGHYDDPNGPSFDSEDIAQIASDKESKMRIVFKN